MEIVRQLLAVLLVFAALGAAVWALRKNGVANWNGLRRRKAGRLETIERVALSPHHALHLVRFGDRALLIAAHTNGCTLLESTPWHEQQNTEAEMPR